MTQMAKLLDALEFAESALVDHITGEDGLDLNRANHIASVCGALLLEHGRISKVEEYSKRPAT